MDSSEERDLTKDMAQEGALENAAPATAKQDAGKNISIILPGIAIALSALALVGTGVTLGQISQLRQAMKELKTTVSKSSTPANNLTAATSVQAPISNTTASNPAPSPTLTSTEFKPGQFVQPAFGKDAQVELLSAKRIQNPDSGQRDVVNVQMRIRRLAPDDVYGDNNINVGAATARNPETSQTYEAVGYDRATGPVSLGSMRKGSSADAYVWLKIPEGVNTVDLFIPDTKAFMKVPISN